MTPAATTRIIKPHPMLRSHLRHIAYREIMVGDMLFPKTVIAEHEVQINLFVNFGVKGFDTSSSSIKYSSPPYNPNNPTQCYFTGIQTSTKGIILIEGRSSIITLHFQPTGFCHIFNISPKEITDKLGHTNDIFYREIDLLYEEIREQTNLAQIIPILENYMIKKLTSSEKKYRNQAIGYAANILLTKDNYSIKQLASDCNLTIQTLEVQFMDQVGIDPKSFACTSRFNKAVLLKLYHPSLTWTKIAHACGFYDQTHLVKDFKRLTGLSPKEFMLIVNPPVEEYLKNSSE